MLHRTFTKVRKASSVVKEHVDNLGYYGGCEERKMESLNLMAEELAGIYGVPVPALALRGGLGAYGMYHIPSQTISLSNTSIVTFLHEFRHHLQHRSDVKTLSDAEKDAQGWACSVFYSAKPNLFEKAVRDGRIMGVMPSDL